MDTYCTETLSKVLSLKVLKRYFFSHKCSTGFISGLLAGHGGVFTDSFSRYAFTALKRCGQVLPSMNTSLDANGWLSKRGTTSVVRMSRMCLSPLPLTVTSSILQSWETHPHNRSSTKWNCWYKVSWSVCCVTVPPNSCPSICNMEQEPTLIRPEDSSQGSKVPVLSCSAPYYSVSFMAICKQGAFDYPLWSQPWCFQAISDCSSWYIATW